MKHKWILLLGACWAALVLAGCVATVDGRRELGLPLVRDKVEARYERPVLDVWTAAKDVLKFNGTLYSEDHLKSTLEASVDTRTVWVRVEAMDPKLTRVTVQARTKNGGADLPLAGEIDKQIAIRLATGNLTPATPAAARNN